MRPVRALAACALLAVAGCGQKGPLYLPDKGAVVVTPPAAGAAAPKPAPAAAPAAAPAGATAPAKPKEQDESSPPK
jgi:predicted small lipoprotein YifL